MRKLSLSLLAAGAALLPSAASAQPAPPPGGMHGGGMYGGGMHGAGMYGGGMRHTMPMPRPHFQHMRRGFVVPQFWWGPQFQVNNWQLYGFANPGADGRWIRYYDDAYLIDREGRIRDSREGLDWDRYGEEWDMADGIPAYRGSRDYRPGEEDYEWAEEHEGRGEHMREMQMRRGPMPGPMPGPMSGPGYAYGGGYTQVYGGGYGYGAYAYPIVIETVTTSAAPAYSEEVVEEYVQVRRAHHRARPRCVCQAPRRVIYRTPPPPVRRAPPPPRPRPPAGERG
jgi:Ni/Co efflux regulator RcnB